MGALAIILMYFFIRELSAYNVTRLLSASDIIAEGIIRFDPEGNTYIWGDKELFRIPVSGEPVEIYGKFTRRFSPCIRDYTCMLVSNRGDVFIKIHNPSQWYEMILKVVKAGSIDSEEVAKGVVDFHVDNNDNLFYVTNEEHGVNINLLRPNSTAPVQILNSTDFMPVIIKSDKSGNVYILMNLTKILVLTNETLQEEQPVPKYINIPETESGKVREIHVFIIDDENHLWILCNDGAGSTSAVVMKLINDTWTEILREDGLEGLFDGVESRLINIKGRIIVVIESRREQNIHYIVSNDKAIKLKGSGSLSGYFSRIQWTADDEGQMYFYNDEKMFTLKPNETEMIPIQMNGNVSSIKYAAADWKNNVWITVDFGIWSRLYHLKKGETTPELMDGAIEGCERTVTSMATNFLTKRIYFTCYDSVQSIDNID